MVEMKPFNGRIWHRLARGPMDIGDCRPHHFRKRTNSVHNVISLECIQSAADLLSPHEQEKSHVRMTICSKHTRENTPLLHHIYHHLLIPSPTISRLAIIRVVLLGLWSLKVLFMLRLIFQGRPPYESSDH